MHRLTLARQANTDQLRGSVCSGTLHCLWESLLMTWILGRCPSLRQAEVLISWAFFYYSAQLDTQTYLANAHAIIALCPVSNSLFFCAAKDMQLKLKLSFQGGLVLQFLFVLLPRALMVSFFFFFLFQVFYDNYTTCSFLRWPVILYWSLGGEN